MGNLTIKKEEFLHYQEDAPECLYGHLLREKKSIIKFIDSLVGDRFFHLCDFYAEIGMDNKTFEKLRKKDELILTDIGVKRLAVGIIAMIPQLAIHLHTRLMVKDPEERKHKDMPQNELDNIRQRYIETFGCLGASLIQNTMKMTEIYKQVRYYRNLCSAKNL